MLEVVFRFIFLQRQYGSYLEPNFKKLPAIAGIEFFSADVKESHLRESCLMTVLLGSRPQQQHRREPQWKMTENGAKPVKSRKGKGKEKINEGVQTFTSKSAVTSLVAETLRKKGSKLDDHDTPWSWTTLADGSVSARPAVFTADGK